MRARVINRGERTRYRLGIGFFPGKEKVVECTNKEYITLIATKDFEVTKLGEKPEQEVPEVEQQETTEPEAEEQENKLEGMSVKEVLRAVRTGIYSAEEALELEKAGKNRKSLIKELQAMKKG